LADHVTASFILCVYNVREYLSTAVDAILAQTRGDFELLLVDDGSTDGSQDLCEAYAARDPRVRVFHIPNGGLASARNYGRDRAKGDYLFFVDGDDICDPRYCERMVGAMEAQDVDAVICGADVFVDAKDAAAGVRAVNPAAFDVGERRIVVRDGALGLFDFNTALWSKAFKRSLLNENGIYNLAGNHYEDDAFWYQYAMCARSAAVIPEKLYHYRIRRGSIMDSDCREKPKNRRDFIEAIDYVVDFAVKHNLVDTYARFLVRVWLGVYAHIAWCFEPEECHDLRQEFIRKTAAFARADNRLAEAGERLVWVNRRRRLSDLLSWGANGLLACFGFKRARFRAARSRAFWKEPA